MQHFRSRRGRISSASLQIHFPLRPERADVSARCLPVSQVLPALKLDGMTAEEEENLSTGGEGARVENDEEKGDVSPNDDHSSAHRT